MTRFHSTRGGGEAVSVSAAMENGLAGDGGLYVPARFPTFAMADFDPAVAPAALAARVLAPFFAGDPLAPHLPEICRAALDFPLPLVDEEADVAVLELFHGPTAAFKDVGARFLAECLARIDRGSDRPRTVLVATSGDTGGAVAAALDGRAGVEVGVLFPLGGVSPEQQHQLTCWGDNVRAFAVRGTFDDCQRMVKQAFADAAWRARRRLTTANSINIGRLLPQVVYYAHAALDFAARRGAAPSFVVPTGNAGNATAALWARAMGFPVLHVAMATNANRAVPDYLDSGEWRPRPALRTLANAMDVGDPSNMERVFDLFPDSRALRAVASAVAVDDAAIGAAIAGGEEAWGRVLDPHTATAVHALSRRPDLRPAIIVATAHPAKFKDIVEPRIGHAVGIPRALQELFGRPCRYSEIDPDLASLQAALP